MKKTDLEQRIDAIGKLLYLFRFERRVYLTVTILSLIVLLLVAGYMAYDDGGDSIPEIIGLFSSAGGITYSAGRLLRMWSEALKVLTPESKGDAK